jgi:glycosyltransferase involved in cell wall biosynthesis
MRVAIVYDCLFPHTVGGAERWYRNLAERLATDHEVIYLTRRQWSDDETPDTSFVVVAVSAGGDLYTRKGRRRIAPPLRFGAGVFLHLLRHGKRYDVVHSASFPYFSLLGAWLALRLRRRARLVVDWHEVWSRDYWIAYLGGVRGRVGHAIQRICARLPDQSFTFSRLHTGRLAAEGHTGAITRLTGEYADDGDRQTRDRDSLAKRPPLVVFAGRHIPEKRVEVIPDAIARAREQSPSLRCVIFGDGPERERVASRITELGLRDCVELRGSVPADVVRRAIADAGCLLLPSLREGYGLVVVEALARATPAVVIAGPENAAVELIEPGVNGFVVPSAEPDAIANQILDVMRRGSELRRSTLEWYEAHEDELSIESSIEVVEATYYRMVRSTE